MLTFVNIGVGGSSKSWHLLTRRRERDQRLPKVCWCYTCMTPNFKDRIVGNFYQTYSLVWPHGYSPKLYLVWAKWKKFFVRIPPSMNCMRHMILQSIANIQIYSNIRIFLAEYLIFEYEYEKIWIRIYSNIWTTEKLGYEYIRIFVNFIRIYSNILLCERVQSFQRASLFGITQ